MTQATLPAVRFSEIVAATEFDQPSDRALILAKNIARRFDAEILAVHVTTPSVPVGTPEGEWFDDSAMVLCDEEELETYGEGLRREGFRVRTLCPYGSVAEQIVEAAEKNNADLVVVGTHARRGVRRLLAGSHAESLARQLNLPLLIVGPKAAALEDGVWKPASVLCACSMDREGRAVAAYTYRLARELGCEWEIACNYVPREVGEQVNWQIFQQDIQNDLPRENGKPVSIRSVFLGEPCAESLVDLAHSRGADLLVLGHCHHFLKWPMLHAGILPKVLAESPCPVMVVPDRERPSKVVQVVSNETQHDQLAGGE